VARNLCIQECCIHLLLNNLLLLFAKLQNLEHNVGDKERQAPSLEKSIPQQNRRNNSAAAIELCVKKLKVSIGNGPDYVDEPRKVTTLQDLADIKGKKSSKWAPTTKKPAKSWGAQNQGIIRNLRPKECKSSD